MTVRVMNLNKLIRICASNESATTAALREDLRNERDNLIGLPTGGGHFQHPWWKAAKDHAVGLCDIESETALLIEALDRRKRLYPIYTNSFLKWLENLKRGTNYQLTWLPEHINTHYVVPGLELTVKVDNLLALRIGPDQHKLVYPYFSEKPPLNSIWARVALWLMSDALSEYSRTDMEILDVVRGLGHSGASVFLKGDEEHIFKERYTALVKEWISLRPQYNLP